MQHAPPQLRQLRQVKQVSKGQSKVTIAPARARGRGRGGIIIIVGRGCATMHGTRGKEELRPVRRGRGRSSNWVAIP